MSTAKRPGTQRGGYVVRARRGLFWIDTNIDENTASGTQDMTDLTTLMVDDEKKGATLVRTILHLDMILTAAGTGGLMALGLVMVDDDAMSAGAVPEANSAGEQPGWIFRSQRVISTTDPNDSSQFLKWDLDIRARRKLTGENSNLLLIINAGSLSASVNSDGWARMLFMRA